MERNKPALSDYDEYMDAEVLEECTPENPCDSCRHDGIILLGMRRKSAEKATDDAWEKNR